METIKRIIKEELGFELYKEQELASKEFVKGNFIEFKTGEAKSLINLVSVYSLLKQKHRKVYVVSVNDYLAKRDYEEFKQVYNRLRLSFVFNAWPSAEKNSNKS